jgi:hypothetical protein
MKYGLTPVIRRISVVVGVRPSFVAHFFSPASTFSFVMGIAPKMMDRSRNGYCRNRRYKNDCSRNGYCRWFCKRELPFALEVTAAEVIAAEIKNPATWTGLVDFAQALLRQLFFKFRISLALSHRDTRSEQSLYAKPLHALFVANRVEKSLP